MQTTRTPDDIQAQLEQFGPSPADNGLLTLIVCRPAHSERQVLAQANLDTVEGLVGDNWYTRGSRHTPDGNAHPEMQLTLMNSRIIQAIAGDKDQWALAGDQLYVDLDLSAENLPVGQRLAIGSAIIEVSPIPHNGCQKFTDRYGSAATRFVNSPQGRQQRRRGINTRVIQSGTIAVGDVIRKISSENGA